jgi:hypothetical protein
MKLNPLSRDKEIWLKEFDHWVTPYLEEIRDSTIFHKTLANIKEVIELLGLTNERFSQAGSSSARHVQEAVERGVQGREPDKVYTLLIAMCDLLFLITGKTDNNFKCQFPVYLKEMLKWDNYPGVRAGKLVQLEVPRVVTAESIAKLFVRLEGLRKEQEPGLSGLGIHEKVRRVETDLLFNYFNCILDQEIYLRSLQVFGTKYFELKEQGNENDILAPLIIFYVRGSASAIGGHLPESILRGHMHNWGLRPNEDFNTVDAISSTQAEGNGAKTRAYDFVLPYHVKNWDQLLFVQSQFYAGDSGSVSHKNVDQTSTSRLSVRAGNHKARFIEYVDGAGYYGSLNGDLRKLFHMEDTENFIQVRTSHLKLRQLLQAIHFLTPLELVHALARCSFHLKRAGDQLEADGYTAEEVERVIQKSLREEIGRIERGGMKVKTEFYQMSRRYFLLDALAVYGAPLRAAEPGYALVPGYEEYFGARVSEILEISKAQAGSYYEDWRDPAVFSADLEFLVRHKWVIFCG